MDEKDKTEEPLIQKKNTIEEYLDKKNQDEQKKGNISTENNIEESEDTESGKLLQTKLRKYSKDDAVNVHEEFEGFRCPANERYTYDPYLESNIINRFFFFEGGQHIARVTGRLDH